MLNNYFIRGCITVNCGGCGGSGGQTGDSLLVVRKRMNFYGDIAEEL